MSGQEKWRLWNYEAVSRDRADDGGDIGDASLRPGNRKHDFVSGGI